MDSRSVQATLNYTADNGVTPNHYFYERGAGDPPSVPAGTESHTVTIESAWPQSAKLSLDVEGFILRPFDGEFSDFEDECSIRGTFHEQVISFVKRHTGARRVEIFDHTVRRRMDDPSNLSDQTTVKRPAVQMVHCDYTANSGPQRVRDCFPEEAEYLLGRRVAFYNVWKPLYNQVEELPLAMCDVKSTPPEDFIKVDLLYKERTGEVYVMRYSPTHRWMYFPLMEANQAIILKTYDSETDGRARFMAHTAFEDPSSPENPIPRESIEVRTMAFF